jgi:predicted nucleotidyltransferase
MAMHLGADQAAAISEFCTRHRVQELALFGSAIRDDFTPASDVDLLIDFAPGEAPSLFGFVDMRDELSAMFGGRQVDLVMKGGLSNYLADRILSERVVLYERRP